MNYLPSLLALMKIAFLHSVAGSSILTFEHKGSNVLVSRWSVKTQWRKQRVGTFAGEGLNLDYAVESGRFLAIHETSKDARLINVVRLFRLDAGRVKQIYKRTFHDQVCIGWTTSKVLTVASFTGLTSAPVTVNGIQVLVSCMQSDSFRWMSAKDRDDGIWCIGEFRRLGITQALGAGDVGDPFDFRLMSVVPCFGPGNVQASRDRKLIVAIHSSGSKNLLSLVRPRSKQEMTDLDATGVTSVALGSTFFLTEIRSGNALISNPTLLVRRLSDLKIIARISEDKYCVEK